jgi:DNA-directed RNA polymerase specialized sigma24 family protein
MQALDDGPPLASDEARARAEAESRVVAAVLADDEAVFLSLVRTWSPVLTSVASAMVGDARCAAELIGPTWLRALEAMRAFRSPPGIRARLMRALLDEARAFGLLDANAEEYQRRSCLGATVVSGRFLPVGNEWAGHLADPPEPWPAFDEDDLRAVLVPALAGLSEPQRVVLSLRDRGGCGVDEVSRIIAVSPRHAHDVLHHARATLHQVIERHVSMMMS